MEAIDNLEGFGKLLFGNIPDPRGTVSEHDLTMRLAEAATRRLSPDTLGERRSFRGDISCESAF
jgi:hypothetical protein